MPRQSVGDLRDQRSLMGLLVVGLTLSCSSKDATRPGGGGGASGNLATTAGAGGGSGSAGGNGGPIGVGTGTGGVLGAAGDSASATGGGAGGVAGSLYIDTDVGGASATVSGGGAGGGSAAGTTAGGGAAGGGAAGTAAGGGATGGAGSAAGGGGTGFGAAGTGGAAVVAGTGGAAVVAGTGGAAVVAGTGGAAVVSTPGTGGGSGTGGGGAIAETQSVLERNKHASRDGAFLQPTLTRARAALISRDMTFVGTFAGSMFASPLYLDNGPGGKGLFFAVTTGNDVVALDETTGAVTWMKNIGSSPQSSGAGCGSIHPIGILSTPVIDAQTRTIYVAGAVGAATIGRHEIHALSVYDGSEKAGWPIDVSTSTFGTVMFNVMPQNQRSALSLVNGILYVAYGGHVGDCGPYRGWVIGINTADPTMRGAWATGGVGEGIWAAGGMASDGNGVFFMTGNSTVGAATHLDSEQVARVTGLATLTRTDANIYYPATWRSMDTTDAD